jgi:hypothetical protein
LEKGRLEWLNAASHAHQIKLTLRSAVEGDSGTEGDVSDAMMVWMYALALNIPSLSAVADKWANKVEMEDRTRPLLGYKADKWDPRTEEWRAVDLGVQEAAEMGGMDDIKAAWEI